jgi:Fe-S cluster assembly protein SufD
MAQSDTSESPYLSSYLTSFAAFEANGASSDPAWLKGLRKQAIADFERDGFPVTRRGNERWKYTDVRALAAKAFVPAPAFDPASDGHQEIDFAPYDLPCPRVHQLVFVDGHYAADLSTEPPSQAAHLAETIGHRSEGLIVGRLAEAVREGLPLVQEHLGGQAGAGAFGALNTAFVEDGALVYIPDGVSVHEPIYLLFITTGRAPTVTHPRVLIVAGANSRATIVQGYESLASAPEAYFTNSITEIVTRPGANLRHYKLQREASSAYHIAGTHAWLGRDSHLASVTLDLGGGLVRNDLMITLAEPGASASMDGLYLADGEQHVDNHTWVDHAVPDTSSNEVYKGILRGASHGVFVGQILVRPDAQRSSAHQINKNLVLSDDAEVDSQPKLEIFADDVQCTHGAAVGRLDPNAVFYLNSRGLDAKEAQELLIRGFVSEVSEAIEDDAIRQYTDQAILAKLG